MITRAFHIVRSLVREHAKANERSPRWSHVRDEHLKTNNVCRACNGTRLLQVHHVKPFHEHPELELDPTNLITLCTWQLCHLKIGHGGDFGFFNPKVREHALAVFCVVKKIAVHEICVVDDNESVTNVIKVKTVKDVWPAARAARKAMSHVRSTAT